MNGEKTDKVSRINRQSHMKLKEQLLVYCLLPHVREGGFHEVPSHRLMAVALVEGNPLEQFGVV